MICGLIKCFGIFKNQVSLLACLIPLFPIPVKLPCSVSERWRRFIGMITDGPEPYDA